MSKLCVCVCFRTCPQGGRREKTLRVGHITLITTTAARRGHALFSRYSTRSLSVCVLVSVSTCLCLYLSVCVRASVSVSLPVCFSVCLSTWGPQSLSVCVGASVSVSLHVYLSVWGGLGLCVSTCLCLSVCLSVSLSIRYVKLCNGMKETLCEEIMACVCARAH